MADVPGKDIGLVSVWTSLWREDEMELRMALNLFRACLLFVGAATQINNRLNQFDRLNLAEAGSNLENREELREFSYFQNRCCSKALCLGGEQGEEEEI